MRHGPGLTVRLGVLAVPTAVVGVALATAGPGRAVAPVACSPDLDVASASQTQLAACGLQRIPLSGTTSLPLGGARQNYDLPDGQVYSIVEPPPGVTPGELSATEDEAYGIPPGSSASDASARFAPVEHAPYVIVGVTPIATPFSASVTAAGDLSPASPDSQSYAGYQQVGTGWTAAEISYTEPHLGSTSCSGPAVAFWAGIGGNTDLGQDGTSSGDSDYDALHQIFFENYPAGPAFPQVTVPAGSDVSAYVYYNGSDSWAYIILVGDNEYVYEANAPYQGTDAWAIVERPGDQPLLNFRSVTIHAQTGRGFANMSPSYEWTMPYASTGSMSNGTYTSDWEKCS